jgi:hypothetical protein
MATRSSISIWNVLALLTVLGGGTLTLLLDQMSIRSWAYSGIRRPIGNEQIVDLPAGELLVYYESPDYVPGQPVYFSIRSADGNRIPYGTPTSDNNFALLMSGWSGRAMWQIDLPEPTRCEVIVLNDMPEFEDEDRSKHQVVFAKQPATLAEATRNRRIIQYLGAGLTIGLAIALYIVHGVTLSRREQTPQQPFGQPVGNTTFRR